MVSIFPFNGRKKFYTVFLFLILPSLALATGQTVVQTSTTNCQIIFQPSNGQPQNQQQIERVFKSCKRKKCMSNLINGACKFEQTFELEEKKCFTECCGASVFNSDQCESFNESKALKQKKRDKIIILALTLTFIFLLILTLIYSIFYMKCLKEEQVKTDKNQNILEYEGVEWINGKHSKIKKCVHCRQEDAYIRLSCGDYYHIKCLKDLDEWECEKCKKVISKMRVFCKFCQQKYVKIKADGAVCLEERILESLAYHQKFCFEEFKTQLRVQLKHTVSTKQ